MALKTQRSTADRTSMRVTVTVHEFGTALATLGLPWMFPVIPRSVEGPKRVACRPREVSDQPFELVASPVSAMLRYLPVELHRLDLQFRVDKRRSYLLGCGHSLSLRWARDARSQLQMIATIVKLSLPDDRG